MTAPPRRLATATSSSSSSFSSSSARLAQRTVRFSPFPLARLGGLRRRSDPRPSKFSLPANVAAARGGSTIRRRQTCRVIPGPSPPGHPLLRLPTPPLPLWVRRVYHWAPCFPCPCSTRPCSVTSPKRARGLGPLAWRVASVRRVRRHAHSSSRTRPGKKPLAPVAAVFLFFSPTIRPRPASGMVRHGSNAVVPSFLEDHK